MKTLSKQEALHKAAAYCSLVERCIFDVEEKLQKWSVDKETSKEVIDYLLKEKFIDEERFTKSFVSDKLTFNKWGKIKITAALKQKKISQELIQTTLENIIEEQYFSILKKLLVNKKMNVKSKDEYDLQNKLIRFGLSRGFSFNEIQSVIKNEIL